MNRNIAALIFPILFLAACRVQSEAASGSEHAESVSIQTPTGRYQWRPVVMGSRWIVAGEHPLQVRAGHRVLQAGGNAVDAAAAIFYMTTVVQPFAGGIGGDAVLLIYLADEGRITFINGTGPAPGLATLERYLELGGIPGDGPLSTDVPGAVAAFDKALRHYGTMSYRELLEPAIEVARNGHPLSFYAADNHWGGVEKLSRFPTSVRALLNEDTTALGPAEIFVQPDLARTLETIATEGAETFYRGSLARVIADFYEAEGGLLRLEDLEAFEAEETSPIRTDYRGHEVYQSAPNSHGIVMLIALNILEGFDLSALGHNSPEYLHVVTETLKLAFADRDQYIGDPRFVPDMPVQELLSKEYADVRRSIIRMDRAIQGAAPAGDPWAVAPVLAGQVVSYQEPAAPAVDTPALLETMEAGPGETSSFAIVDPYGNVVSVTHSVNGVWGSGMVVADGGFVLNNRMPYFHLDEGDVNVLEPGKRPRHTISPAMAFKDGKPFLAWNTPGGDNQPQAMLQSFLNVVEFGMNVQQAVEVPMISTSALHASNHPHRVRGELVVPHGLPEPVAEAMVALGHHVVKGTMRRPTHQAPLGARAVKMVMIHPETDALMGGVAPAKDSYVEAW